jgi:hypothetical protein
MKNIHKHDFAVVPLHAAKGMKAQEQTVLFWMWAYALSGTPWTWGELGEVAGTTGATAQKVVETWVAEGLVFEVPEGERTGNKPSHRYGLACGMVADRPLSQPVAPTKAVHYEGWVFTAIETWRQFRGIVGPMQVKRDLELAVKVHGSKRVLDALNRYAERADPKFNPSMQHFVRNLEKWADRQERSGPVPRAMVEDDAVPESKAEEKKTEGGVPSAEEYGPVPF